MVLNTDNTYCVISLYIVALTQIALLFTLAQFFLTAFLSLYSFENFYTFRNVMLYVYRTVIYTQTAIILELFFVQMIEWWVMLFFIEFEKNYRLEQIVYMQNNTSIIIKKEKKLKWKIGVVLSLLNIIVIGSGIVIWVSELPDHRNDYRKYRQIIHVISGVIISSTGLLTGLVFWRLYSLMRTRHNFEFKRTKRTM